MIGKVGQNMKQFLDPELKIIRFDVEDVITNSEGTGEKLYPGDVDNGVGWG